MAGYPGHLVLDVDRHRGPASFLLVLLLAGPAAGVEPPAAALEREGVLLMGFRLTAFHARGMGRVDDAAFAHHAGVGERPAWAAPRAAEIHFDGGGAKLEA